MQVINRDETRTVARMFYVPTDIRDVVQRVICKTGDAEAWTWMRDGAFCAVAFCGNASHPYSGTARPGGAYKFRTADARRTFIADCFARATAKADHKLKAAAEKAALRCLPHSLSVGDVLSSSWGYEQTNVDYYQITRLIGARTVEYRKVAAERIETLSMQGLSAPKLDDFVGAPKRARVSEYGAQDSIKVDGHYASKLEAKTVAGVKVFKASHWTAYG